jgi:hypothetical protein
MADDAEEQSTESEALRDVATAVDAWKRDCDLEFTPNTHSPDDVAKPEKVRPHDFRVNQKRRLSLHPPRTEDVQILTTNNDQDPDGDNAYKSHPPKPTDTANVLRSPSSARRAVIAAVDAWKRACDLSPSLRSSETSAAAPVHTGELHVRKKRQLAPDEELVGSSGHEDAIQSFSVMPPRSRKPSNTGAGRFMPPWWPKRQGSSGASRTSSITNRGVGRETIAPGSVTTKSDVASDMPVAANQMKPKALLTPRSVSVFDDSMDSTARHLPSFAGMDNSGRAASSKAVSEKSLKPSEGSTSVQRNPLIRNQTHGIPHTALAIEDQAEIQLPAPQQATKQSLIAAPPVPVVPESTTVTYPGNNGMPWHSSRVAPAVAAPQNYALSNKPGTTTTAFYPGMPAHMPIIELRRDETWKETDVIFGTSRLLIRKTKGSAYLKDLVTVWKSRFRHGNSSKKRTIRNEIILAIEKTGGQFMEQGKDGKIFPAAREVVSRKLSVMMRDA